MPDAPGALGMLALVLRPYPAAEQAKSLARTYRALANMPDVPAIVVHPRERGATCGGRR